LFAAIAVSGLTGCPNPASGSAGTAIVESPVITVSDNHFYQTVSITAESGATIHYTDDGSTPTAASATYSESFNVAGWGVTKTIKAIAVQSGSSSAAASQTVAATTWTQMGVSGTASAWAGMYAAPSSFLDATGTAAYFSAAYDVCTDSQYVYVADEYNNMIRRVSKSDASVTTLCSGSTVWKSCASAADGEIVSIGGPSAIATDGIWLYVNYDMAGLKKINIATGAVTTLPSMPNTITSIATDGSNLYLSSFPGHVIWKYALATGVRTTLAGSGISGSADGTGTEASFYRPSGVATDGTNLYVADSGNYTIRKVVLASGLVSTISGAAASIGTTNGAAASARFNYVYGLAYDGNHECLYIADNGNSKIRRLDFSSMTVIDQASITNPGCIAADGSRLYVGTAETQVMRIE